MTIAIAIKIHDGVVLASDSASTLTITSNGQTTVKNIYNNGNKIFNLYKGLPIGAVTWGLGNIGPASIATLAKDFRKLITEDPKWKIDPTTYTMEEVAGKFKSFIFDQKYSIEVQNPSRGTDIGFYLAGYSAGKDLAEVWSLETDNGQLPTPEMLLGLDETAALWSGDPDAIYRIYLGHSIYLPVILEMAKLEKDKIEEIMDLCRKFLKTPFIEPPMPIQDAVDLATFLVETTINFKRFGPGHKTVGGPVEVAAITKHEGFKWIKRKHYYDTSLNQG